MVIFTASCSHLTGLLAKISLLRCDSVSDNKVTGQGSLAIVQKSQEGVYVVRAVLVAAVVEAALVVAAVVVTATGVESSLIVAVVVVVEPSQSVAFLSTAAMMLIDVNSMLVIGYH